MPAYSKMDYQTHTLANGIRIIHQMDTMPIHYCGFAVNAGTRDELEEEEGMAHFIEHMLFKGTKKRKSWHVLNRLESVGGGLDAYTTKEETFVYATVPNLYVERAMELLGDVMFNSTFSPHEIKKETDVILEEIQLYNDSPSELIYDDFDEQVFAGSSLGKNILGNEKTLASFTSGDAVRFMERCYTTTEMVFFSMGNVAFDKIVRWAEKYFAMPRSERLFKRQKPVAYAPTHVTQTKDTCQAHCIVGNRAFGIDDENTTAMFLLTNILGGPNMSSYLNLAVRERRGLVYTIESSYVPYSDTGIFTIYFGCDEKHIDKCFLLIDKELRKVMEQPLDARHLLVAKRQTAGGLLIESQNKESLALSMAKSFLHQNRFLPYEAVIEKVSAVTAEQMCNVAQQLFAPENLSRLIYK
jgi:predicted Zn-dependent peptidase